MMSGRIWGVAVWSVDGEVHSALSLRPFEGVESEGNGTSDTDNERADADDPDECRGELEDEEVREEESEPACDGDSRGFAGDDGDEVTGHESPDSCQDADGCDGDADLPESGLELGIGTTRSRDVLTTTDPPGRCSTTDPECLKE